MILSVLSLFTGIGLHDLGLERAGFRIAAQVEIDPYCRAVLANHWPEVTRFDDVRTVSADALRLAGVGRIDLVTGGFPCQDISVAGKGAGLDGKRSGLWHEMRRIVSDVRPDWVLAENVPALRTRGSDRVLTDLAALGYTCWPLVVGALHAGAPHRRLRVWIVAHLARHCEPGQPEGAGADGVRARTGSDALRWGLADANGAELRIESGRSCREGWSEASEPGRSGATLANRNSDGFEVERRSELLDGERTASGDDVDGRGEWRLGNAAGSGREAARDASKEPAEDADIASSRVGDSDRSRLAILRGERGDDGEERQAAERAGRGDVPDAQGERREGQGDGRISGSWARCDGTRWPARPGQPQHEWEAPRLTQSRVGGAAHGYARRVDVLVRRDRLRALGNANPPQVPEAIGRAILAAQRRMTEAEDAA